MHGKLRLGGRRPGKRWIILGLLALSFVTGCASPYQNPSLYTGAGLGAALGAGLGAAINHSNPWRGAAIGGLLGAAGGGIAGAAYGQANQSTNQPSQQGYYQQPQQGYQQPPRQGDYQQPYYEAPNG